MASPRFRFIVQTTALVIAGDHTKARAAVDRLYSLYPAWRTGLRENLGRFLPDAVMADRVAGDFTAATADLTQ